MTALYNEFDPHAAQWLRNLIAAGHIAPGHVDDRSITELTPDDLADATQVHLFAGIGVWSYAPRVAGWPDELSAWSGAGRLRGGAPRPEGASSGAGRVNGRVGDIARPSSATRGLDHPDHPGLEGLGGDEPHIDQSRWFGALADGPSPETGPPRATNGFWGDAVWLPFRDGKLRPTGPTTPVLAHGSSGRVAVVCPDGKRRINRTGAIKGFGNAIVAPLAAHFIRAVMAHIEETEAA